MSGILYGVGVGPGDPELLTFQAARIMRECDVIAVPKSGDGEGVALAIARRAVPELAKKPILELAMPMTRDRAELDRNHDKAAQALAALLREGKNIAFLTLGDPSIYSTYAYVHKRVLALGLQAQLIAGVPSFCAVAACLNETLTEGAEPLHVLPASYAGAQDGLALLGTKVLMKAGKAFEQMKAELARRGQLKNAKMVQKCGMEGETIYKDLALANENASYFSIIVVKDREETR